jgi:hypothetical protein
LKFSGNEAGAANYYFNGGVWPQGNAWYALALIAEGEKDEALYFIKETMTLAGIMAGPNGQPAMYEVRNSNKSDPLKYGSIDKPQFMWAAAWYLYCLYNLYCIYEDHWNLSFSPYITHNQNYYDFRLHAYGQLLHVYVEVPEEEIGKATYDGTDYPNIVIPWENHSTGKIKIHPGKPLHPFVKSSNSALLYCTYDEFHKKQSIRLKAFIGHQNKTIIVTPWNIKAVHCDGKNVTKDIQLTEKNSYSEVLVLSVHQDVYKEIEIVFF